MHIMKNRFMTVQDMTQELGISRTTAYQLIKKIKHTKIGRRLLVTEEDLLDYLHNHTEVRNSLNQNNNT
jgi:excisionase family DNA binding protein